MGFSVSKPQGGRAPIPDLELNISLLRERCKRLDEEDDSDLSVEDLQLFRDRALKIGNRWVHVREAAQQKIGSYPEVRNEATRVDQEISETEDDLVRDPNRALKNATLKIAVPPRKWKNVFSILLTILRAVAEDTGVFMVVLAPLKEKRRTQIGLATGGIVLAWAAGALESIPALSNALYLDKADYDHNVEVEIAFSEYNKMNDYRVDPTHFARAARLLGDMFESSAKAVSNTIFGSIILDDDASYTSCILGMVAGVLSTFVYDYFLRHKIEATVKDPAKFNIDQVNTDADTLIINDAQRRKMICAVRVGANLVPLLLFAVGITVAMIRKSHATDESQAADDSLFKLALERCFPALVNYSLALKAFNKFSIQNQQFTQERSYGDMIVLREQTRVFKKTVPKNREERAADVARWDEDQAATIHFKEKVEEILELNSRIIQIYQEKIKNCQAKAKEASNGEASTSTAGNSQGGSSKGKEKEL